MNCPGCGHTNPLRAKFCLECGTPFALRCASCSVELPLGAKFCLECGAATGAAPRAATPIAPTPSADSRKVVSIVFADLVGSTALHERLEPESARGFMESYYTAMRGAVESQGGTVTQLLGDGVKAVFGIPRVAEDDAIRAVRAAALMQDAFRALAEQQRDAVGATGLRVAVNTGEVVANDATEIIGDPVNVAARLQEQGGDGDVVVGESTHRLVATLVTLELLGSFALKGRSEAVRAYRVVSLERPAGAATAAFVGRDDELARLAAVYETAVAKPAAALAVLLGSPGLGKSRLIDEFARRHADAATVVQAHCSAEGGATFAPLAVALRELLGIEDGASAEVLRATIEAALPAGDADRARIAGGVASLLAGSPASPEETFFVVRRLIGALAHAKPVVLVIDDLHWAESLLLDLVEHLVQWGSGVALLVLIGARPELRDLRSSLVTPGGLVADVVTLSGLDAGAAMRLAANVIGAGDLPAAIAAKVLATSEGNPLFVGELVRMLVREGALTKDGDRWTAGANLAALEMPPTIHALLAARIERLRPEERSVLERAAVVGRHFSRSAVAALLPREAGDLDARLEALHRTELIERDTGWLLGEPVLRFHHVLIRDAAYRRLLKGTRAELHAKLADWIEAQVGDAPEHDETIGWHLEQANVFLRELGPLDDAGRTLGARAAQHLAAAGRRALARDDLPVAADLLGRALDRLDVADPARADLALDWCEALLSAGDVGAAAGALDELARFTADSDRLRAWHACFTGQLTVLTAPEALQQTAEAVAQAAKELTDLGDAAGEAKAHFVNAQALARLGKVGACEAALAAARRAGDRRRANAVLAGAPIAALWGPSPVTRASGRCLDVVRVLRITQGAPAVESVALSCQGVLEALRGRTEAARRMIASARRMVEELGIANRLFEADVFASRIELLEGDAATAERLLRGAYDGLRDLGLGIDAAQAGALLARALLAQDRVAEAEAVSHESEALAGDGLQAAIAWRGVRAEALAKRGEHAAAIELAQAAVAIAAATDALLDHADARMALAAALRAAGRGAEADAEERRATLLWEAKGATLLAERARGDGGRAAPATVAAADPEAAPPAARRRVRPNAASALLGAQNAAIAARDFDAFAATFREDYEEVHHPTGSTWGTEANIASLHALFRSREPHFEADPFAALGELLVLIRRRIRAAGTSSRRYDVGAYENEVTQLLEVDESGLGRHSEVFAADHLGDAIVRLYERHAELLPEGPERERAAAVARAIAAMNGPIDLDRLAATYAPATQIRDHRVLSTWSAQSAEEGLRHWRLQLELAPNVAGRYDDVLALGLDAVVVQMTFCGTGRDSGGAFENRICVVFRFGADGRVTDTEVFEAEREADALARFDALVAGTPVQVPIRRRVRANAATRSFERGDAVLNARDGDALAELFDESLHVVHHPSGLTYGRREMLKTWRSALKAERFEFRQQILASLGDALALDRHITVVEGLSGADFAGFGLTEVDEISLLEVDERGRWIRSEIFAADRLGEAIARLYELHAERQSEGPERARAAATARSIAAMASQPDAARRAAVFAPDIEMLDHRTIGTWSASGAEAVVRHFESIDLVADEPRLRDHDVLALDAGALLVLRTHTGIAKESGGAYERRFLMVLATGQDGSLARIEWFDVDCEAEALARFDALTAGVAPPRVVRRRVRANASSAAETRFAAALAARDFAAVEAMVGERAEVIDHRWHMHHGRASFVQTYRRIMQAEGAELHDEPVATLGEGLILVRCVHTASGTTAGRFDVGEHTTEYLRLMEVDGAAQIQRAEMFAVDRLGEAVARLYELHAERLPEGAARTRSEATARTVAVVAPGGFGIDRYTEVFRSDAEIVDHKVLGHGSDIGVQMLFRSMAAASEVGDELVSRPQEVLALNHDALLLRWLASGVGRESGGAFEWAFLRLFVFDADGRVARYELFDDEREAEALARFDELAGGNTSASREHSFANAASRANRMRTDSFNSRDWAGVEACVSPDLVFDERRRLLRNTADRRLWLEQTRLLFEVPESRFTIELVATRGERLSLHLQEFDGQVAGGGGPLAVGPHFALHEVDRDGRIVAIVLFDLEDRDAAHAELDRRFDAGEAASHPEISAAWAARARAVQARDWDAVAALYAPSFVSADHRPLGFPSGGGIDAHIKGFQAMFELAPDARVLTDHKILSNRGVLTSVCWQGTRDGGAFEIPQIGVAEFDAHGKFCRLDIYAPEQLDRALARFAELAAPASAEHPFANAASRYNERFVRAWEARDWNAVRALHRPECQVDDRRRLMRIEAPAEDGFRFFFDQPRSRWIVTPLATRGERLVLSRLLLECNVDEEGGAAAIDYLCVDEVDADGQSAAMVVFDPDDEGAAYAELDARFDAGEGAAHARTLAAWRRREHAVAIRDWDAFNAMRSPGFVFRDHRLLGFGTMSDGASVVRLVQSLVDLAPDVRRRHDHIRICERGILEHLTQFGTRDGGAFEHVFLAVYETDAQGRSAAIDNYDVDRFDLARARFAELENATRQPRFANTASRALDQMMATWLARDWDAYARILAPEYRQSDRRRLVQLELDREQAIAFTRQLGEMVATRAEAELLATRGDRLALSRIRAVATEGDVGPSEIVSLLLTETNDRGEGIAGVRFDVEDQGAAYAELDARYDVLEAALHPHVTAARMAQRRPYLDRDWDAFAATHAPDLVVHDHRLLGWGTLHGVDAWMRTQQVLVELAPDTRVRNDHVTTSEHGFLSSVLAFGTRDGGAFELAFLRVSEINAAGKICRIDFYDIDDVDAALARFSELAAPAETAPPHFENAASRAWRVAIDAWRARDVARFEATQPRLLHYRDHRRLFQLDLDRQGFLDFTRPLLTMRTGSMSVELVATRGERLALMRFTMMLEDETVGPSAIDSLLLVETDERGEIAAYDRWDLADEDAAWAELEARWEAGEGAQHPAHVAFRRAFNAALAHRDWDAVVACYAPDFVGEDHRLVSWGTLRGPAFVAAFRTMVELAPDARLRWDHLRVSGQALIAEAIWLGTRDGGAFESPLVLVSLLGAHGKALRTDFYDPHHLDRALARFGEIAASTPSDPLAALAVPNAASAAMDRWQAAYDVAFDTGDWEPMRALGATDFVLEDRRRFAQLSGDVELMIAASKERVAMGARLQQRLLGTAGDRIAIRNALWSGGPTDGPFEIEYLAVSEVDEADRITAILMFDLDDLRGAQREAWQRWFAIDPAAREIAEPIGALTDAFNEHDAAQFRALLADDLVVEDHRLAGLGRLDGADTYVASIVALWELAPDTRGEMGLRWPAFDRHGAITVLRRGGLLPDGGEFESVYLFLLLIARGRIHHVEMFELEAQGAALARFEALRPESDH